MPLPRRLYLSLLQLTCPCALHLYGWRCLTFAKTWNSTWSTLTAAAGKYQSHNLCVFLPICPLPDRKRPGKHRLLQRPRFPATSEPHLDPSHPSQFRLLLVTSLPIPTPNIRQNAIFDCRTSANRTKPPGEDTTTPALPTISCISVLRPGQPRQKVRQIGRVK